MDYGADIHDHALRLAAFERRDDARRVRTAAHRPRRRGTAARARRIASAGIAIASILVATIMVGLVIDGIGFTGIFIAAGMIAAVLLAIALWPARAERPIEPYREDMPNQAVVQRFARLLDRSRLPVVTAASVDAIGRQLPLLERQLGQLDPLDPVAQDARRLMGQHVPELIERYERLPAEQRRAPDGEGMSGDQHLAAGLRVAQEAVDDLARRLTRDEAQALEAQSRFLESRYGDSGPGS